MGEEFEAGRDALRRIRPVGVLFGVDRSGRFPVGEEIAADGWTTRQGRFSVFVPAAGPLAGGLLVELRPAVLAFERIVLDCAFHQNHSLHLWDLLPAHAPGPGRLSPCHTPAR
jgi:hypothetical protein